MAQIGEGNEGYDSVPLLLSALGWLSIRKRKPSPKVLAHAEERVSAAIESCRKLLKKKEATAIRKFWKDFPKAALTLFYLPNVKHEGDQFLLKEPAYQVLISFAQSAQDFTYLVVTSGANPDGQTLFVSRRYGLMSGSEMFLAKTVTDSPLSNESHIEIEKFSEHLAKASGKKISTKPEEQLWGRLRLSDLDSYYVRFPCYNRSLHTIHDVTSTHNQSFSLLQSWLATGQSTKLPSGSNVMRLFMISQLWDTWEQFESTWDQRTKWINENFKYSGLTHLRFSSSNSFQHWCRDNFAPYS